MRIALAQMNICYENKTKNKEKCLDFLCKAKDKNIDFIIFPEMSLTGFSMAVETIGEKDCETISWFKEQAIEFGIYIGFGYVEKYEDKGLNNFSIISPSGEEILKYSKLHPFSYSGENDFYHKGSKISLTKIDDFNLASFICYDLRFPEIFQIASKNSELITIAANWPAARREHWITLLKARAIENQCYVAAVNAVGIINDISYSGDSMIIAPNGSIISEASEGEELIIADVTIDKVDSLRRSFPLKLDRREELYKSFLK